MVEASDREQKHKSGQAKRKGGTPLLRTREEPLKVGAAGSKASLTQSLMDS